MNLKKFFKAFQRNERGVTALEYAILAGVVVVAVAALGDTISGLYTKTFDTISAKVNTAVGGTATTKP